MIRKKAKTVLLAQVGGLGTGGIQLVPSTFLSDVLVRLDAGGLIAQNL